MSWPKLLPCPPFQRRPPLRDCMAAIAQPELYRNFAVHLLVMAPAGTVMAWIASRIDHVLGWAPLVPWPWSLIPGLGLIIAGGLWVWYVYGYLFLSGRGSPGSHVDGGPTVLVDTGPYTMIRHPSVLGKVAGVLGLAMLFGSKVFLVAFLPLLVAYSLLTNRYLQERACDARFGDAYARYRRLVPMIVPRPAGIARWLRDEGALGEAAPASGPSPRIAFIELRWYLLGLVCLIAFFVGVFALVLGMSGG
ncbi:MAG: isoprenylcysteine carboxylmethyltransferase family protein [Pseudomonadota bacterium]